MRSPVASHVAVGALCAAWVWGVPPAASAQISYESAKLVPADAESQDDLGLSVAVSGEVAVVGALNHDAGGSGAGAAYVYRRDESSWNLEQKLQPSDLQAGDAFGAAVGVSGNVALIGATQNDDNGAAYAFRYNGSSWVEEDKLVASDGSSQDIFGFSVSVDGDVVLIGANFDDDNGFSSGSAYVFRNSGSTWTEEDKLLASDGATGDFFGTSVSIAGDVAVVGSFAADTTVTAGGGAAYVFRRSGSVWVEEQKLIADDGVNGAKFGFSVAVNADGDMILVGADHDDGAFGADAGAVYAFDWNGSSWVQVQKLTPAIGAFTDQFGIDVSISGDTALIGASFHGPDEPAGQLSGSAFIFRRTGPSWLEYQTLRPSDGVNNDEFGTSVSLSGEVAVVGAYEHDGSAAASGAAYVYNRTLSCVGDECVPAASTWGLIALALALLIAATITLRRPAPA